MLTHFKPKGNCGTEMKNFNSIHSVRYTTIQVFKSRFSLICKLGNAYKPFICIQDKNGQIKETHVSGAGKMIGTDLE